MYLFLKNKYINIMNAVFTSLFYLIKRLTNIVKIAKSMQEGHQEIPYSTIFNCAPGHIAT